MLSKAVKHIIEQIISTGLRSPLHNASGGKKQFGKVDEIYGILFSGVENVRFPLISDNYSSVKKNI